MVMRLGAGSLDFGDYIEGGSSPCCRSYSPLPAWRIRWVIAASIPHYIRLLTSVAHIASAFPIKVALLATSVAGSD